MVHIITRSAIFDNAWVSPMPVFFKRSLEQIVDFLNKKGFDISPRYYEWTESIAHVDTGVYLQRGTLVCFSPKWNMELDCTQREPYHIPDYVFKHYLKLKSSDGSVFIHLQFEEGDGIESKVWIDVDLPESINDEFLSFLNS